MPTQPTSQFFEELRQKNKARFEQAAIHWNTLANERQSELSKSILTVSTVILPLTFFIFNSSEIGVLSVLEKILILAMWLCLIVSIYFGIEYTEVETKHFNSWTKFANQKVKEYSTIILSTSKDPEKKYATMSSAADAVNIPPIQSDQQSFNYQKKALIIGIAILFLIITSILFRLGEDTTGMRSKPCIYPEQPSFVTYPYCTIR